MVKQNNEMASFVVKVMYCLSEYIVRTWTSPLTNKLIIIRQDRDIPQTYNDGE
jgi:hypothetical protein